MIKDIITFLGQFFIAKIAINYINKNYNLNTSVLPKIKILLIVNSLIENIKKNNYNKINILHYY